MLAELVAAAGVVSGTWQNEPSLPLPRTEVAGASCAARSTWLAATWQMGSSSARVDVYSPATRRWRRERDLPLAVNHATAAAYRGRLYVSAVTARNGERPSDPRMCSPSGSWRTAAPMPVPRAAGGGRDRRWTMLCTSSAVVRPSGHPRSRCVRIRSAAAALVDGSVDRQPREHLAAASLGGWVYAVAGRLGGIDTNQTTVEFAHAGRALLETSRLRSPRRAAGPAPRSPRAV